MKSQAKPDAANRMRSGFEAIKPIAEQLVLSLISDHVETPSYFVDASGREEGKAILWAFTANHITRIPVNVRFGRRPSLEQFLGCPAMEDAHAYLLMATPLNFGQFCEWTHNSPLQIGEL